MNTVSKSKLKAKMLEYFREVEKTGAEIIVTDHNEPVLKIIPFERKMAIDDIFFDVRKTAKYTSDNDIMESTSEEWGQKIR
ncbi:MAG: Prevent-host-death family protein [uncultured bacterium]|nr:MAG: Prevent-host-death family protein [uncultured bacterium]